MGKHYRESGKVAWQANSLTGSEDEEFRQWLVPVAWTRATDIDEHSAAVTGSKQSTADDLENLDVLASAASGSVEGGSSSGQGDANKVGTAVKTGKKTADEVRIEKTQKLTDNIADYLSSLKQIGVDLKLIQMGAEKGKYGGVIASEAKQLLAKIDKIVKALEKILFGETF